MGLNPSMKHKNEQANTQKSHILLKIHRTVLVRSRRNHIEPKLYLLVGTLLLVLPLPQYTTTRFRTSGKVPDLLIADEAELLLGSRKNASSSLRPQECLLPWRWNRFKNRPSTYQRGNGARFGKPTSGKRVEPDEGEWRFDFCGTTTRMTPVSCAS